MREKDKKCTGKFLRTHHRYFNIEQGDEGGPKNSSQPFVQDCA